MQEELRSWFASYGIPYPDQALSIGVIEKTIAIHGKERWTRAVRRDLMDEAIELFEEARARLQRQANRMFSNLQEFNKLLRFLGRSPQPSTNKACEAMSSIHVNIYDLIAAYNADNSGTFNGRTFPSVKELAKYSRAKNLIFPRDKAKSEGLRHFLRHFFNH
ncbi:hypothetical protein CAOG_03730 [Capsaspora owczarzaki ATCC 30864]|uniref:Uncharacterized protein n=1 Tax=Capsaspora owczarzaki (strain ATCC 30864) TaxID=595528 RepID=A0A0D2VQC1_CAPO3|nr:hypothetical protein CAOG_03730 [Capsaspora owczarzaki ATCC 30864]KJE92832.1 hypothetical protein CAOG_003730 [Capsaspora owczarzaki ATCC 30864]|eukprot:XP_004363458.1 hypothetical protein CAOG_03730 [Capsaspora owczarzaki ATCC 30864]